MKPAERLSNVTEYYFSRKLREVARMNAEGKDIISLAIGSPDMPPSEATIATLCEVARRHDTHGYQPTAGTPELRRAMARYYERTYGIALNPDSEVLPLIGSKEGILHVTLAFVNPGETVLVPNPGYPTYTSLSKLLGANVETYDLLDNGQPDFEELRSRDLSQVRLMWTNYPHMPTGAPARRETYDRLVELARSNDFVIANDNPYSRILANKEHPSLSILSSPRAKECCVEMNSLSKSHNMSGWRVGMCVGNEQFISWILKVKSNIDSGTFRGIQLAAAAALENADEWHHEYNYEVYARRRRLAEQIMRTLGCTYNEEQVGMFLWGRIPEHYHDAEELTERLLHEARVFITPGFIFGENGRRNIRISLCANEEKLQTALKRIEGIARAIEH